MSLEFVLFINDSGATSDWRHHLASHLRLRTIQREHRNFCGICANDDFDPERVDDSEDGFLYFPWRLHCNPEPGRTEPEQIELARRLRRLIEETGCRVEVGAAFEDKV